MISDVNAKHVDVFGLVSLLTFVMLLSSCSRSSELPVDLGQACYEIASPNASIVRSPVYARVADVLEPITRAKDGSIEVEASNDGYIVKARWNDQLSGNGKQIALQFDKAASQAVNDLDHPLSNHCGPQLYRIQRSIVDGEEQGPVGTAQVVGILLEKSSWQTEGMRQWKQADLAKQKAKTRDSYDKDSNVMVTDVNDTEGMETMSTEEMIGNN